MLTAWIQWLSSRTLGELLLIAWPLLCVDGLRYGLATVVMCLADAVRDVVDWLRDGPASQEEFRPPICVVLAGLNEADTIGATLESVWGSYAPMEIIVVDDGSTDGMADVAKKFAQDHPGVMVIRKPQRGGKSSALNCALPFAKAPILVCVDTDSHVEPGAIERIVQPFRDPRVAAASGAVVARNANTSLLTRLQAAEYLRSVFVGRLLSSRLGVLSIVSGAFGAYRRSALERTGGWDVGPGEDGDLVLRLRKGGWQVRHVPLAQCLTNLPTKWRQLFKQRRRWEWAAVTFECRKHLDLANVRSPGFRLSNLAILAETWFFRILLTYLAAASMVVMAVCWPGWFVYALLTNYALCVLLELAQWMVVMFYTPKPARDAWALLCVPLMPAYFLFIKAASLVAYTEEFFWRRSYRDTFVPAHVSRRTWQW
ncbi:Poly-beta-1,6-N-acetyl-D-glucosamine synthase [Posidoniimonas polymericola]|uniref:Poly-beta-1,6-N-acetyl-D-glucosamine synthase n=1 Tax=Posidoniimonas polymericola TaxID=2528002 RepID=A0A5C5YC54_9BACT|nr:glycosyltransferase [Posidoniimonas polymericola]TWT72684.1 Poly-beta-1,6-N-acetyl-D-glucosamine synthase [Posidoniimonas polymericola]